MQLLTSAELTDVEVVEARIERNLLSLARLIPSLPTRSRLLIVYSAPASELPPHHAALQGFARTVRRERPGLLIKTIAVPDGDSAGGIIRCEAADAKNADVRYLADSRQILSYEETELGAVDGALRQNSVFLITGGAGALGRIFAEHLTAHHGARVVRCGRGKAEGTDYIRADIANREEVHRLVAEVKGRFGRIDGIIHAAGIRHDALLEAKTREQIAAGLAPKIRGALNLDEATRDEPLRCFVMFSAAAAALGNPGQSDYACANSFLDHFAAWRNARLVAGTRQGRTLSIQWPLWAGGGMHVDAHSQELLKRTVGMMPMTRADGLAMFDAALASDVASVTVLCGRQAKLREALGVRSASRTHAPVGTASDAVAFTRIPAALLDDLAILVSHILKVESEDIDAHEHLAGYGFDSITFTQLANGVNRKYDLEITPALFFEHPTIASVAGRLCADHGDRISRVYETSPQRPERRSSDSAAASQIEAPLTLPDARPPRVEPVLPARDVAIIGIAGALPRSADLEKFWEHLVAGNDLISEVPSSRWVWRTRPEARWGGFVPGVDEFDCRFFGISPREAALMDPQQRLFLAQTLAVRRGRGLPRVGPRRQPDRRLRRRCLPPTTTSCCGSAERTIDGYTAIGIALLDPRQPRLALLRLPRTERAGRHRLLELARRRPPRRRGDPPTATARRRSPAA